jgi:hypothetical protein
MLDTKLEVSTLGCILDILMFESFFELIDSECILDILTFESIFELIDSKSILIHLFEAFQSTVFTAQMWLMSPLRVHMGSPHKYFQIIMKHLQSLKPLFFPLQGRRQEGVYWYKKAAELGDSAGQCNLGLAYLQGTSMVLLDILYE